ncbi:MAG: DUF3160 domain-containing protein [Polyangiaceae bacterium]|nr:DUF3160 domain-containing protein [Polyangiaceae bacterium]
MKNTSRFFCTLAALGLAAACTDSDSTGGSHAEGGTSNVGTGGASDVGTGGASDVGTGGTGDIGTGGASDVGTGGTGDIGTGGASDVGTGGAGEFGAGAPGHVGGGIATAGRAAAGAAGSSGVVSTGGSGGLDLASPVDIGYVAAPIIDRAPLLSGTTSEVVYSAVVPGYDLPLDVAEISNLSTDLSGSSLIGWTADAEAKLAAHGIVLLPGGVGLKRFDQAYARLKAADAPTLVTTDSTLHLYHLFFDQVLKSLEMNELIPVYETLLPAVVDRLRGLYAALDGDTAEAARRSTAALAVAAKLMFPDTFSVPPEAATEVNDVIELVNASQGFAPEPIFNHDCSEDLACSGHDLSDEDYEAGAACFCEDYSQYKPRGHYTEHPALERYFRGAMYLGRIGLRLKSPMETRMAAVLTSAMAATSVPFRGAELPAMTLWDRLRRVTSFFVGAPDDLTFIEYDQVLREVYGENFQLTALEAQTQLDTLRTRLRELRAPKIQSGIVQSYANLTEQTQGLRFLGQSFAFDSYALGQLVFDHVGPNVDHADYQYVVDYPDDVIINGNYCSKGAGYTGNFASCDGQSEADWAWLCCKALALASLEGRPELTDLCRLLPKGLDVAAAYGSSRAEEHLAPDHGYCGYADQLAGLQSETAAFTDEDHYSSLYTGWLHSLNPLFERNYTGFPSWMSADAYRDKALQTGLTSWAELRHDTILYVKQSYTSGVGGSATTGGNGPVAPEVNRYYVEPQPEVYSRLSDLTRLTQNGLSELEMLAEGLDGPIGRLEVLLDRLKSISIAELQHQVLEDADQNYIKGIGATFESIITSIGSATAIAPEPPSGPAVLVQAVEGDPYKTTVVADVHTDGNTQRVLEVGSGYIDWVAVVNLDPTGALVANIGPAFSYYEFPQPLSQRLNDDEWDAMLTGPEPPARPPFVAELYAE